MSAPEETLLDGYGWYYGVCKAASCPKPDGKFRRQVKIQHLVDEIFYCSTACQKRAAKLRIERRCPTAECLNPIVKPGEPCCGPCMLVISGMCLGKNRYTEMYAFKVQNMTTYQARYCVVCQAWHNTSRPTEDELDLQTKARRVMAGIRESRGDDFLARLIASFDPLYSSRRAWRDRREAIRVELAGDEQAA